MTIKHKKYELHTEEDYGIQEVYYKGKKVGNCTGSILRNERKIKKLAVSKIAKAVNETTDMIHKIEGGFLRPPESLLKKLADAYSYNDDYPLLAFLMGYITRNEYLITMGIGYKVDLSVILCESDNSIVYYEGRLLEPKEKLNMLLAVEIIDAIN